MPTLLRHVSCCAHIKFATCLGIHLARALATTRIWATGWRTGRGHIQPDRRVGLHSVLSRGSPVNHVVAAEARESTLLPPVDSSASRAQRTRTSSHPVRGARRQQYWTRTTCGGVSPYKVTPPNNTTKTRDYILCTVLGGGRLDDRGLVRA